MDAQNLGNKSFEEMLSRLEEIIRVLEQGDAPLDASLSLYTEGAALIRACTKKLDEAEQEVAKLRKGPKGPLEVPMEDDEDDDSYYGLCSGL